MDMKKAETIIDLAMGMKRHEWDRIAHYVRRAFERAEGRIEFTPELAKTAKDLLQLDCGENIAERAEKNFRDGGEKMEITFPEYNRK